MSNKSQAIAHEIYAVEDVAEIHSPGLLVYLDLVKSNLAEMIRVAGGAGRLCPHCKTHKTREIAKLMLDGGVTHHKCATIAEAEMLASVGIEDILVAYQLVGPNIFRFSKLIDKFPSVKFATLVDNPTSLDQLSTEMQTRGLETGVLIDLETGMGRTGIDLGPQAIELVEMAMASDGIRFDGLHWYDGHNRQSDFQERAAATNAGWKQFQRFHDQVLLSGIPVNRIVAAGIGSFPVLANAPDTNLQLSPGTPIYFDAEMEAKFPEMNYRSAALVLTRVVSANRRGRLTLDVGHKACSADMPAGNRLRFPCVPDAREISQTEEHCVIETGIADQFPVGSATVAIPTHACPTSAVHQFANIIADGKVVDRWEVAGRNRMITV